MTPHERFAFFKLLLAMYPIHPDIIDAALAAMPKKWRKPWAERMYDQLLEKMVRHDAWRQSHRKPAAATLDLGRRGCELKWAKPDRSLGEAAMDLGVSKHRLSNAVEKYCGWEGIDDPFAVKKRRVSD
jgi:hypothetical protein